VLAHRAHRYVLVSAVPCIPRVRRPWDRVRLAWVRVFHRRDQFAREAVRVHQPAGRVSAMFRVA
jgi:hypothetical protein